MITDHELGEQAHQLINNGTFKKTNLHAIKDKWAVGIISQFIESHSIEWSVCTEKIGPIFIIKLEDDYLKHLLIMTHKSYEGQKCDEFYWLNGDNPNIDEHGIHPDVASTYLLRKAHPDIEGTNITYETGSSTTEITLPDGRQSVLRMSNNMLTDDTWAKE